MTITLFHSPGACSRTQLVLLEAAGAPYDLRIVRLPAGENRLPAFLAFNPKGKVPVLQDGGRVLTENVAIATWLGRRFPAAGFMPAIGDEVAHTQALSWLAFVASGLHPTIFRARMAARVAPGAEDAHAAIKAAAVADLQAQLQVAEDHLATRDWLVADRWTAPDVYLWWALGRGAEAGVDLAKLPRLAALKARLDAEPAVQRALQREAAAVAALPA